MPGDMHNDHAVTRRTFLSMTAAAAGRPQGTTYVGSAATRSCVTGRTQAEKYFSCRVVWYKVRLHSSSRFPRNVSTLEG
jgi:hypothetical protein